MGRIRKYYLNQDYFNKIDNQNKAYFLGLMYADGHISNRKYLCINLQEEDRCVLEEFKNCLEYTGPLQLLKAKIKGRKNQYKLCIYSPKLCESIIKLGCEPRKSLILKFPTKDQVPDKLLKHFVRGYFDGDGCIHKNGVGVSLVSTNDFCLGLQDKIKDLLKIDTSFIFKNKYYKNNITREFKITTYNDAEKFLDWIYKTGLISLPRKYSRYIEIKIFMRNKRKIKYKLKSPAGELFKISGVYNEFETFCKKNGLQSSNMNRVFSGHYSNHKGWTGTKLNV